MAYVGVIADIPNDAQLWQDTQDVEVLRSHGYDKRGKYDSYFVISRDGEIIKVWGFYGCVAYLNKSAFKIRKPSIRRKK